MKRKFTAVLLALVLVFSAACTGAYADGPSSGTAEFTCSQQLRYLLAVQIVDNCNRQVEAEVCRAQATPQDDVAQMLKNVDGILNYTVMLVSLLGFEVQCSYAEYTVDGQTVLIDPLRVINPIGSGTK